jgi:hypothetical protein
VTRNLLPLPLALLASFLLAAPVAGAAASRSIHKCTGPDGKTVFSDSPCLASADAEPAPAPKPVAPPKPAPPPAAKVEKKPPAEPGDCSDWLPPEEDVVVDQPPKIDPESLPHDASGKPVEIFVSKRSATTAAAACSAMVSTCSHKNDDPGGAIDVCFKSAPRCTSDRPWEEPMACCPQACWDKYVQLRRSCLAASTASYRALFQEHCAAGAAAPAP